MSFDWKWPIQLKPLAQPGGYHFLFAPTSLMKTIIAFSGSFICFINSMRKQKKSINPLIFLIVFSSAIWMDGAHAKTIIKHHSQSFSPVLRAYLNNALILILEKSLNDFGPYEVHLYSEPMSSNRTKIETEKGQKIDISFSSRWNGHFLDEKNVIQVNFPVLKGLLGLRTLAIPTNITQPFQQVDNILEFKQFSAGLGLDWIDVEVFNANHIKVIGAKHFDALFPMLHAKRFDYIPLSILEIHPDILNGREDSDFTFDSQVNLYYAMPFYAFINAERQDIAERIQHGLKIALNDGSLDALFNQHFSHIGTHLKKQKRQLMVLNNPFLNAAHNKAYLDVLLEHYQDTFELLKQ